MKIDGEEHDTIEVNAVYVGRKSDRFKYEGNYNLELYSSRIGRILIVEADPGDHEGPVAYAGIYPFLRDWREVTRTMG